jgi:alcohol dehydrogenase
MMIAASMGATAFQKGLGAMHSLSHPCSANLHTHHGLTNGVVMPYVLAWNRAALNEKLRRLGSFLELRDASFDGVLDWILTLRRELNIPHTLAELGMQEHHVDQFAPQAFTDPSTGGNPLPMTTDDFATLYRYCIRGQLPGV